MPTTAKCVGYIVLPAIALVFAIFGEGLEDTSSRPVRPRSFSNPLFGGRTTTASERKTPVSATEHLNRGNDLFDGDDPEAAITEYDQALKISPGLDEARFYRAQAHLDVGNYEKALNDANELLRLCDHDADSHYLRACALAELGSHEKAMTSLNLAIKLEPNVPDFYFTRALIWDENGSRQRAIADFHRSIKLGPDFYETYNELAWIYATSSDAKYRDSKQALAYAVRAVKLTDGKEPIAMDTLAAAYAESGNFEKARKAQSIAIKLAAESDRAEMRDRLALYETDQPYRESSLRDLPK
jgi:tetratricopeptide (TPR) repeat protein